MTMPSNRLSCPKKSPVLMVPSSASTSRQWDALAVALHGFPVVPFELHSHGGGGLLPDSKPLTLEQEGARILNAVPEDASFHLVGHSYGGGVALKLASCHAHRLKSLTLIEPSSFHLLRQSTFHADAFAEIQGVADKVSHEVMCGNHQRAMQHFIDYWCGAGTWASFDDVRKAKFSRLSVHVCHHFRALFEEAATLEDYARVNVPTLIICGTQSPVPARVLTRLINEALPSARHATIAWAGHMSPITHPAEVNRLIKKHLTKADAKEVEAGARIPAEASPGADRQRSRAA
jgi:pimeloyl-ACP methyl ester carboxylesterase